MENQYIQKIILGCRYEIGFSVMGEPNRMAIYEDNCTTSISDGNVDFQPVIEYLKSNKLPFNEGITWVQEIRAENGILKYYKTDKGDFVVDSRNHIAEMIRSRIENKKIEIKTDQEEIKISSYEINTFTQRGFILNRLSDPSCGCELNTDDFNIPSGVQVLLFQSIEPNYFDESIIVKNTMTGIGGNVIRIKVDGKSAVKLYKWCRNYLSKDTIQILDAQFNSDCALHQRRPSQGPRAMWCMGWVILQQYIWVAAIHISNRVINVINQQAHRKPVRYIVRDELGERSTLRAFSENGSNYVWFVSSLMDSQIGIYCDDLTWRYGKIDLAVHRVKFLINQGLYFESLVVAQAIFESVVNGLFPEDVMMQVFSRSEIKWEQKYKLLNNYYSSIVRERSPLIALFKGGLKRIYEYRNRFSHDVMAHGPDYRFDIGVHNEVSQLLISITDSHETSILFDDIGVVYRQRDGFINWLKSRPST